MKQNIIQTENETFREALRQFLEKEAKPHYEQWERDGQVPRSFWRKMGDGGFLCPQVQKSYGGSEADFSYSSIIVEELARIGGGLIDISIHNEIVIPYIERYGTNRQKRKYLPKAVKGAFIGPIGIAEDSGSDFDAIETTAIKKDNYYVINGKKKFLTNVYHADFVIVACKVEPCVEQPYREISIFLVDIDTPGLFPREKVRKSGQFSNDSHELLFENVKVPHFNLLGESGKGFYYIMQNLVKERLVMSVASMVVAETILKETIVYVKDRKAFGRTISQYQKNQFKIAKMQAEIEIGRTFVDRLVDRYTRRKQVDKEVSMAKWWTTDLVKQVASECLQIYGGYGYIGEYKLARRYRKAVAGSIYAGSNEMLKVIIEKNAGLSRCK